MKKDIGAVLALYPTPLVVVGAMVEGKPNWALVGHLGIIGHDRIMLSMAKAHYTNRGIHLTGVLSVNIVDEALLRKADQPGCISGNSADKSAMFAWSEGAAGAPLLNESKLTMECRVVDRYDTAAFDNFILEIQHTYAEESILSAAGKPDYDVFKPVLFEMPGYTYLRTGETIGKCMKLRKDD